MNVTIFNTASPLTEEDIDQAEQRIGQPIPAAYRAFLIAHNGGQPDPDGFSSYAENGEVHDQSLVSWFFGLNTGSYYNDLEQHYQLVLERRVPSDLLPIASDPGGNLICLSVDGSSTDV